MLTHALQFASFGQSGDRPNGSALPNDVKIQQSHTGVKLPLLYSDAYSSYGFRTAAAGCLL